MKRSETFELLINQFGDFFVPTEELALTITGLTRSGLKRKLKNRTLSKNLCSLFSEDTVSIREFANYIDDLRGINEQF